jgi:hypothetical protein
MYNEPEEMTKVKRLRLYLESTMFNYYFDSNRDGHVDTVRMFEAIGAKKYEGFTSGYTITELENAAEPKRSEMLSLIGKYGISVIGITDEADRLADVYIREGVISANHRFDSSHIAIASVHDLDFLLSFNFKHINRIRTKRMTELINLKEGYKGVTICTPMEVLD